MDIDIEKALQNLANVVTILVGAYTFFRAWKGK